MPGETANIAAMAEKVSSELFSLLGWKLSGPTNENFDCLKSETHGKTHSEHPVDAVFFYDDPWKDVRNYLLTDLKSYAKDSITAKGISSAIRELSKAVDCANSSGEWGKRYADDSVNWKVHGLLFIYNHDDEFDRNFDAILKDVRPSKLFTPKNSRLYVMGPARISYLLDLINDVKICRADGVLPEGDAIVFSYPDKIARYPKEAELPVARIEDLQGPIQLLRHAGGRKTKVPGFFIYYDGPGDDASEFEFLFDYCFRNQLVLDGHTVSFRLPRAGGNALKAFEQARTRFLDHIKQYADISHRLEQFQIAPVETHRRVFSTERIGMERRTNG